MMVHERFPREVVVILVSVFDNDGIMNADFLYAI